MDFLQKHPTPWRLGHLVTKGTLANYQAIVDANGQEVIATLDAESYLSRFCGEIDELIDWVNTLGGER